MVFKTLVNKINELKKHKGFIKYFTNTSWLLIDKVNRLVLGLFISIWLARYLSVEKFGDFNFAISLVGIFLVFTTLGLDAIVIKKIVEGERKYNNVLGSSVILKFFGSILLLLILYILLHYSSLDKNVSSLVFFMGIATLFHSLRVIDFFFQAKVLSKYVAYVNIVVQIITLIIYALFIYLELGLVYFGIIFVIESFLWALGFIFLYSSKVGSIFKWKFKFNISKELLLESWPLILTGLIISIYMKIDQVMIKFMIGSESVGYYSAAVRISEAWYFIPTIISSSVFPAIINFKKKSKIIYLERLQNLYDFMALISIAVGVLVSFFGHFLIKIIYGIEYIESSGILIIHIWSGVFVSLGVARGKWILAENLQRYAVVYLLGGCIVNVVLNYLLIPTYGNIGAALASLFAQFSGVFIIPFFIKKTRQSSVMLLKSLVFLSTIKMIYKWIK